jgi:hypothetical protein
MGRLAPEKSEILYTTDEQIAALADRIGPELSRIRKRGRLPPKLFLPITKLAVMSTVEVVAFEAGSDANRVLIGRRGNDPGDKHFQGRLNLPGSVVLPTDKLEPVQWTMDDGTPVDVGRAVISRDFTSVADRILATELKGSVKRVPDMHAQEFMHYLIWGNARKENKTEVWTEVQLAEGHEGVLRGDFYETQEIIHHPPEDLVYGHHYFVERALQAYRAAEWNL